MPSAVPSALREGQCVELVIREKTRLGYVADVGSSLTGMVYHTDVFQPLDIGQRLAGYVKKVRDDGKVDLTLQRPGPGGIGDVAAVILAALREHGGFMPVTDSSPPDVVYSLFGVSKKSYKKAAGALYRKRLITIGEDGIRLVAVRAR